jgi:very-short-patch-repair endonuclease
MFTSESAKSARAKVSSKSSSENGKKGYQALVSKGKEKLAAQKAAEWRLNHPSNLEKIVAGWLNELNIQYKREVNIDRYYVDFLVDNLAIEVNGAQWHEKEELRPGQKNRDQSKYRTLIGLGYTVLILPKVTLSLASLKKNYKNYSKSIFILCELSIDIFTNVC